MNEKIVGSVRTATQEDLPALAGIWEEAVSATHDFLSAADFEEIRACLPEYFDRTDIYVYEEGGVAKGFLGVAGGKVEMLFVCEPGRGIGTALLDFAIVVGARRVDVNEQNGKAAAFYEKRGFEVCGRSETDGGGRHYPLLHMKLKK